MKQRNKTAELLCPAGSPSALAAAVEGGADAVYLGGTAFNARIHAHNFTRDELREGIALAHAYGVKVYVTANTLIYDREMDEFLRAAEDAYLCGADALIIADWGAAMQIRKRIPIELHASTQMSGHNAEAAHRLSQAGFSRMVCAREMSREDLRDFVRQSPIEAEVFVHGALCVCHSGQCLFSSLVGGRSGNRGECAQPCRLPFFTPKGKNEYPLSLKDLSLAAYVPELTEMGIASFKIEGRMKSPEYVRDVTRIWRWLLDENRGADDGEMRELASAFSRGGFTDGYYTGRIGRDMLGIRSGADKQTTRSAEPFTGLTRKIPLTLYATVKADAPVGLTVQTDSGLSVTVTGEIPQTARTAPLDRDTVARCIGKWGNTPYVAERTEVELEEHLMLPISSLNALRRKAAEALLQACQPSRLPVEENQPSEVEKESPRACSGVGRSAIFYRPDQIPDEAYSFFEILYAPLFRYCANTNGVALPPVIYDREREEIRNRLLQAKAAGAEYVLLSNLGQLSLANECGLIPMGDFRLNVTNSKSKSYWEAQGIGEPIASPELTLAQLRDLGEGGRAIVYGRVPLMITEKCVGKELADCSACQRGKLELTDRRRVRFPVLREWKHRSLIFNSVPIWMADRQSELEKYRIRRQHFIFTVESREQILCVMEAYRKGLPPNGEVRRIR